MEQALGWLRWPPAAFWGATLAEVCAGVCGFVESRTGKNPRQQSERMAALYREAREAEEAEGIWRE
jgi:hypothetical protein